MNLHPKIQRNWLTAFFVVGLTAAFVSALYREMQSTEQRREVKQTERRARRSVLKQIALIDLRKYRES